MDGSQNGSPPRIPGLIYISPLGEGGMSHVWKAFDTHRNETVAVKILKSEFSDDAGDIGHFRNEERAIEDISHPGIVKGYRFGHASGVWYCVMEYVDGYDFSTLLKRKGRISQSDCLLICESVAAALDCAWNDHGVVHCDIKPDNIMVNSRGEIKIADLGLCHVFADMADASHKDSDHVTGTPAYISPEQIYGDVEPDCRADIYSLGATLYHLSTGRVLFPSLGSEETLRAHCDENAAGRDPRFYNPMLSEGFCQMLEAMLVKDRDCRLQSWEETLSVCADVLNGAMFKQRQDSSPSSMKLGFTT